MPVIMTICDELLNQLQRCYLIRSSFCDIDLISLFKVVARGY